MGSCVSYQIEKETSKETSEVNISYDISYDKKTITSSVYYSPKHKRVLLVRLLT
jgi:hypothetical protein